jgi:hypothetical protein
MSEGLHAKMSALARRKSTSTTYYFGSRVELTLNALSLGGSGVEGYLLRLLGGLEASHVLGRGAGALVGQHLHICDKRLIEHKGLSVLDALDVAVECVLN